MNTPSSYFEEIHRHPDPFGYGKRWYEARKRALLLAILPRLHFTNAWEMGCSNGELTAALAPRCDALVGTDISARAVALARVRTREFPHVRIAQACHPQDWEAGEFDLIVMSEIGYYLDAASLARVIQQLADSSMPKKGVVVACHWRHRFEWASSSAPAVHGGLEDALGGARFRYEDEDFWLDAWSAEPLSVAQQEGLR